MNNKRHKATKAMRSYCVSWTNERERLNANYTHICVHIYTEFALWMVPSRVYSPPHTHTQTRAASQSFGWYVCAQHSQPTVYGYVSMCARWYHTRYSECVPKWEKEKCLCRLASRELKNRRTCTCARSHSYRGCFSHIESVHWNRHSTDQTVCSHRVYECSVCCWRMRIASIDPRKIYFIYTNDWRLRFSLTFDRVF